MYKSGTEVRLGIQQFKRRDQKPDIKVEGVTFIHLPGTAIIFNSYNISIPPYTYVDKISTNTLNPGKREISRE